jgi:SPFH domain / Band 7 family
MNLSLTPLTDALNKAFAVTATFARDGVRHLVGARRLLITAGIAAAGAWMLIEHPPVETVPAGDMAVRTNQLTGDVTVLGDGPALKLPALHELRQFSLRDRVVRPAGGREATGPAPFQSVEGLSIGVDLSVRYAVDPAKIA